MVNTLLLADDNSTTQRVIELTFAEHGMRIVTVTDGHQAVEKLSSDRPDIVLVDVGLANVDGYELARHVAMRPSLQDVPVLLLTGAFDAIDEQRLRESGAAGVLVKPIEPQTVINRVKELLGMRGKQLRAPAPGAGRLITYSETPPARGNTRQPEPARGMTSREIERSVDRPPAAREPERPPVSRDADRSLERAPAVVRDLGRAGERVERARESTASWDQLRRETGLGPDTHAVEGQSQADSFDDLDAAFASLDAQLAGKNAPLGRVAPQPPTPRIPAAMDPNVRPSAQKETKPSATEPATPPVFEIDDDWFDEFGRRQEGEEDVRTESKRSAVDLSAVVPGAPTANRAPVTADAPPPRPRPAAEPDKPSTPPAAVEAATPARPAPPVEVARPRPVVVVKEAQPPVPAKTAPEPVKPAAPATVDVADAFAALLAAEQREAPPARMASAPAAPIATPPVAPVTAASIAAAAAPIAFSDEVIERISTQIAARLSDGLLRETVTRVVSDVAERLVREEIARIRAGAQKKS